MKKTKKNNIIAVGVIGLVVGAMTGIYAGGSLMLGSLSIPRNLETPKDIKVNFREAADTVKSQIGTISKEEMRQHDLPNTTTNNSNGSKTGANPEEYFDPTLGLKYAKDSTAKNNSFEKCVKNQKVGDRTIYSYCQGKDFSLEKGVVYFGKEFTKNGCGYLAVNLKNSGGEEWVDKIGVGVIDVSFVDKFGKTVPENNITIINDTSVASYQNYKTLIGKWSINPEQKKASGVSGQTGPDTFSAPGYQGALPVFAIYSKDFLMNIDHISFQRMSTNGGITEYRFDNLDFSSFDYPSDEEQEDNHYLYCIS